MCWQREKQVTARKGRGATGELGKVEWGWSPGSSGGSEKPGIGDSADQRHRKERGLSPEGSEDPTESVQPEIRLVTSSLYFCRIILVVA